MLSFFIRSPRKILLVPTVSGSLKQSSVAMMPSRGFPYTAWLWNLSLSRILTYVIRALKNRFTSTHPPLPSIEHWQGENYVKHDLIRQKINVFFLKIECNHKFTLLYFSDDSMTEKCTISLQVI